MPSIVWSAVAAFALCAGCTGQLTSSGTVDAGESGSDGRGSSAPSPDGPLATADGAAGFTCRTGTTSYSSGHHNPGQDCNGSCHDHGFTLAGTLFTTATGST
ncbi:MAG TPA: hypothetical protein VLX92_25920, partial [Kofleriaceae bacterium]|nr:hypothetical protein [Kofleriaceae bacterium]